VPWSGWRGANRDAHVAWLPARLPKQPNIVWRMPLSGAGVGGVAATGDYVVVSDRELDDTLDVFRCLSARTGEELWAQRYPSPGMLDYGNSPRATPLIAGDKCWLLGAHGQLSCVDLATGRERWQLDLKTAFGLVEELKWGLCGSPLLVDGKLIVYPGGPQAAIVALEPATGRTIWKTPGNPPAYGSLNVGILGGVRQIVGHDATTLGGWDIATGKRLWTLEPPVIGDFNVPTPIIYQGRLIVATENNGARLYAFDERGKIRPESVATFADLAPDTHTPAVAGNRLFGVSQTLFCLDLTGSPSLKLLWTGKDPAFLDHTSLIASDNRLLIFTSEGELLLIDARAPEFALLGRLSVLPGERGLLSHPALVGDRLYVRGSAEIVCVKLQD
jgi:outer membrane protein assembly factor BamB